MDIALIEPAIEPSGYNLYAIIVNGVCLVEEYIDSLDEKNRAQIFPLFQHVLTVGPPKNEAKFKKLETHIFELKTSGGVRILGFFAGPKFPKSLVLTHGFDKPHRKILKREIKKAINLHEDYFSADEINIISDQGD